MNHKALVMTFILILVVVIIASSSGLLLLKVESFSNPYIDINVSPPNWIILDSTEMVTLTIKNKLESSIQVKVLINTTYDNVEVLYPVQSHVVNIPPRETKTLDIVLRGLKEGEELVIITVAIPEYDYTLERTFRIPVFSESRMRSVSINLYAGFSIFHVELYRRPERAEVYLCGLKATYLEDNKYAIKIPDIYKTCRVNVSGILGLHLGHDLGELTVNDNMDLVIPDLTLSLISIVFSWLLLVPKYFAYTFTCRRIKLIKLDCEDNALLYSILLLTFLIFITPISSFRLDLFLNLYVVVYELLFIVGSFVVVTSIRLKLRLKRALSRPKEVQQVRPVKKGEKVKKQEGLVAYWDRSKPLETIDNELLQVILRTRVKGPPSREYGEVYAVPAEFKEFLRVDLPGEMRLVNCGADSCVFACGEYAIKIPLKMAMMIKAGIKTPPSLELKEIESVKKEVEKVYNLDHDNIIKLLDYSINPPILVYELADGSLADYKNLDLKTALTISIQISEALRYIHSRGLVHGDLKPSNILISKGLVKLGDFSSTTYLLGRASGSDLRTCTVGYCAPEQHFSDLRMDPKFKACENRVDIYQLANVILVMLGIEPLDGSRWSEEELESRLGKVDREDLRDLLRKMLAREPWSRPPAEEVLKSLLTIWRNTGS